MKIIVAWRTINSTSTHLGVQGRKEVVLNIRRAVLVILLVLMFVLMFHNVVWAYVVERAIAGETRAESKEELKCLSLPSRHSIRSEYRDDLGVLVISSEDGPTGIDGGLIYLLSSYRTCSR